MKKENLEKVVIIFCILGELQGVSSPVLNVSAVLGQTAVVPCFCLEDKDGVAMNFTRLDTPGGQHVMFLCDNRSEEAHQIPRYIGRVGWKNWILLIHNVTHQDAGTFMCIGYYSVSGSEDREMVQCPVSLTVTGGNNTRLPEPTTPAAEEEKREMQRIFKIVVPPVVLILIFLFLFVPKFFIR